MAVIENFNRIINITFLTAMGRTRKIVCPAHGRKPNITINGSLNNDLKLAAFNVEIKNLYMDLAGLSVLSVTNQKDPFVSIIVEAGYEGKLIQFTGNIFSMYQQSPSPEGSVIVQCNYGEIMDSWCGAKLSLDIKEGASLKDVLTEISNDLGLESAPFLTSTPSTAMFTAPFQFSGSAMNALTQIRNRFVDQHISIKIRDNKICAWCYTNKESIIPINLNFLSSPVQVTAGDSEGGYTVTLSSRWLPQLNVGDALKYPSSVYVKNASTVGTASNTNTVIVDNIQFHFSTVGSVNNMIVKGYKA